MTRFLSKREVKALTTYSSTHIQRLEDAGQFPKRMRLGTGRYCRVAWVETEVHGWMEAQISKRDKATQTAP